MICVREGPPKPPTDPSIPIVKASSQDSPCVEATIMWEMQHPANLVFYRDVAFLSDRIHLLVNAFHGQPYAGIRSRMVVTQTGEEVASIRLGDRLRSFHETSLSEQIIGCTDKRLVLFDRQAIRSQHKNNVPYFVNAVLPVDSARVLLGTDSYVTLYHLVSETISRRKVASCEGLFLSPAGGAFICAGKTGQIFHTSEELSLPRVVCTAQPFSEAKASLNTSQLWLSLKISPRSPNVVLRCDLQAKIPKITVFEFPVTFRHIEVAEAGDRLFLIDDQRCHIATVTGDSAQIDYAVIVSDSEQIVAVSTSDPYLATWAEYHDHSRIAGMTYKT